MATTVRLGAALVLAMALVMSAVAAAPVTFAVLAGDALGEVAVPVAVPVAVLVAAGLLELLDDPQATAAVASAAAMMTAGTVLPPLRAVNLADTMNLPFAMAIPTARQFIQSVTVPGAGRRAAG
ncbi:MAG: hypothetical protein ABSA02_01855 [Trebonia sp.]